MAKNDSSSPLPSTNENLKRNAAVCAMEESCYTACKNCDRAASSIDLQRTGVAELSCSHNGCTNQV